MSPQAALHHVLPPSRKGRTIYFRSEPTRTSLPFSIVTHWPELAVD